MVDVLRKLLLLYLLMKFIKEGEELAELHEPIVVKVPMIKRR